MNVRDFREELAFSRDENIARVLDNTYRKMFLNLTDIKYVTDIDLQKKGVDKILVFGKKEYYIDEKIRKKGYGDILLEEYSVYEQRIIGWLGRDHLTDYISYVVKPAKYLYFLPFLLLQRAWVKNYKLWYTQYGQKFAPNKGYSTSNIPVPVRVLFESICRPAAFWEGEEEI